MDWKKFIKPTILKSAIALLFFLLFVPFISHDNGLQCIKAPCPSASTSPASVYLLEYHAYRIFEFKYLDAAAGLAISYLVSCAISSKTAREGS